MILAPWQMFYFMIVIPAYGLATEFGLLISCLCMLGILHRITNVKTGNQESSFNSMDTDELDLVYLECLKFPILLKFASLCSQAYRRILANGVYGESVIAVSASYLDTSPFLITNSSACRLLIEETRGMGVQRTYGALVVLS